MTIWNCRDEGRLFRIFDGLRRVELRAIVEQGHQSRRFHEPRPEQIDEGNRRPSLHRQHNPTVTLAKFKDDATARTAHVEALNDDGVNHGGTTRKGSCAPPLGLMVPPAKAFAPDRATHPGRPEHHPASNEASQPLA